MNRLVLAETALEDIRAHGEETYPDECCGFLVIREAPAGNDGDRIIGRIVRAANEYEGERRRRFEIRPQELRAAEAALAPTTDLVGGFYHSHPDHPARPSEFDTEHAWPWYSYLVLAVEHGRARDLGAFQLDPDTRVFARVAFDLEAGDRRGSGNGEVSENLSVTYRVK
jgi:proteasome lid subunit RPN8/RPN11